MSNTDLNVPDHFSLTIGSLRLRFPEQALASALAFVVFLAITGAFARIAPQSLIWAMCYLLVLIWSFMTPKHSYRALNAALPILVLPVLAAVSVLWSVNPGSTMRYAVHFIFTTWIALKIAYAISPNRAMLILAATLLLSSLGTIANWQIGFLQPNTELSGELIGIFAQKNMAGRALALCAIAMIATSVFIRKRWLGLIFVLIPLSALPATESVSGMIASGFALIILILSFVNLASATARFAALSVILFWIFSFIAICIAANFDPVPAVLEALGKTPDLTGRGDIWAVGMDVWRDHFILGTGFAAFWSSPYLFDEIGLLHATVDDRLNGFHNSFVESGATLGIGGVVAFVFAYMSCFIATLRWYVRSGHVTALFWFCCVFAGLILSVQDVVLFREHETFHTLSTMALVFAYKALRPQPLFPTQKEEGRGAR